MTRIGLVALALVLLLLPSPLAAEQQRYTVSAQAPELAVNTQGEAKIIVEAAEGYTMDAKFASKMKFIPEVGDEVLVARVVGKPALSEENRRLSWTVAMTGKKPGKHPVQVKLKFSVCKAKECITARSEMRMGVVVKD